MNEWISFKKPFFKYLIDHSMYLKFRWYSMRTPASVIDKMTGEKMEIWAWVPKIRMMPIMARTEIIGRVLAKPNTTNNNLFKEAVEYLNGYRWQSFAPSQPTGKVIKPDAFHIYDLMTDGKGLYIRMYTYYQIKGPVI